jgi:hypothetical protein
MLSFVTLTIPFCWPDADKRNSRQCSGVCCAILGGFVALLCGDGKCSGITAPEFARVHPTDAVRGISQIRVRGCTSECEIARARLRRRGTLDRANTDRR